MKKLAVVIGIICMVGATAPQLFAESTPEPTIYVVKRGDTLWDISERFFKDPFFWPNLWSRNPTIGNPHFIYPGQKLRILPDRIEVVTTPVPSSPTAGSESATPGDLKSIREKIFQVFGSEGFITEKELAGVGRIVATNHDRVIVGAMDTVYTDIGSGHEDRKSTRLNSSH